MGEQNLFQGKKVRLSAVTSKDYATVVKWYDDSSFSRNMSSYPAKLQTEEMTASWVESAQKSSSAFPFAIRPLDGEELIGIAMIDEIIWATGVGTLSIGIGDAKHRGQGYGRDVMELLLRYAFDELNLHRLGLTVFSYNENAVGLYEQMGFLHEGTVREYGKRDGKRYDKLLYGILRSEWIRDTL